MNETTVIEKAEQATIQELIKNDTNKNKETLNISLEVFDGPLDALYNLVLKHKIEIENIHISEITKQLVTYLKDFKDVELSSDMLNMASRLLYLKSAFLIKRHRALEEELALKEEEEEIARQIKLKLEEYTKYKHASEFITAKMDLVNRSYFRNAPEIITHEVFSTENLSKESIYKALLHMSELEIEKIKSNLIGQANDSKLKTIYKKQFLRVEDKIQSINEELKLKESIKISDYIKEESKDNKIVTFLAILEMCKAKKVRLIQNEVFGEIYINKIMEIEV